MRRKVEFCAGYCYHIYNRGVARQPIFFNDGNWYFFLKRLREHFTSDLVDIIAYCLMPNHYHLLVYLRCHDLSSRIMQPFTVSYSKAINAQQRRVGPLFQGPFQAILVDTDEYLLHLSRYIHLNPVHAGLAARAEDWEFSSYRDYLGLREGTLPKPGLVLGQFPSPQVYRQFVADYVDADRRVIQHLTID